jgi:hypothetical protein
VKVVWVRFLATAEPSSGSIFSGKTIIFMFLHAEAAGIDDLVNKPSFAGG